MVEFSQSQYVVCEDAGSLAVRIVRTGALNHSSTVAVRIRSMSAKRTSDFNAVSDSLVQFLPGKLSASQRCGLGLCLLEYRLT